MISRAVRAEKLIVAPNGLFRRHKTGMEIPKGWIIIRDQSVFYQYELLDIFKSVPMLRESDYKVDDAGGTNG